MLPRQGGSVFFARVLPIEGIDAWTESDKVRVRPTTGVNARLGELPDATCEPSNEGRPLRSPWEVDLTFGIGQPIILV